MRQRSKGWWSSAGVVPIALDLIEDWVKSVENAPRPVPNWIDALLLVLDQATRTQPAVVSPTCHLAAVSQ